jgi:hypothetical protein
MNLRTRCATIAAVAAALLAPAAASAAPPANDERTAPAVLGSLPAQVTGTTAEATRTASDPFSPCGQPGPQVWYRFTAPANGRVAVRLQADGDLDAVVDAYLSERSQTRPIACDRTDANGLGAVDFQVAKDKVYLVSVTQLPNSVAGTFTLTVVAPQPAPRPPGPALAPGGADGTLDRVGNIEDAYAITMRAGRTYRLRLSGRSEQDCRLSAALYAPGAADFDGRPLKRLGCDESGYATYTPGPGEGGRHSVLVVAARGIRTLQRYHLEAAGAGPDDTAPGLFLANRTTLGGALNGARIDALDLYRFSVARRSDLTLNLATSDANAFDLLVLNERGRRVNCTCGDSGNLELTRVIAPGRYFVAVRVRDRGIGTYRLRRSSRLLTRTTVGIDRRATLGTSARIGVRVRPAVSGPVTIVIQRFDPLDGWLFARRERVRASGGRATLSFAAPTVGRWRVQATFDGTIGAGSSASGFDELLVVSRPPPDAGPRS